MSGNLFGAYGEGSSLAAVIFLISAGVLLICTSSDCAERLYNGFVGNKCVAHAYLTVLNSTRGLHYCVLSANEFIGSWSKVIGFARIFKTYPHHLGGVFGLLCGCRCEAVRQQAFGKNFIVGDPESVRRKLIGIRRGAYKRLG